MSLADRPPTPEAFTIIIPTFNRPQILTGTIKRLRFHIRFEGDVYIIVGDDGDVAKFEDTSYDDDIKVLDGPREGLGANLNMLLDEVTTDLVMQMDDDHWLNEDLDVNEYARDLVDPRFNIGWIRLFLGERKDYYSMDTYYKFMAATYGPYWYVSPDSPEMYIASMRPHLKHVDFHRKHFGSYAEHIKLGETEVNFCQRYKDMRSKVRNWGELPWVTVPMFGLTQYQWQHVGESWQKRGY